MHPTQGDFEHRLVPARGRVVKSAEYHGLGQLRVSISFVGKIKPRTSISNVVNPDELPASYIIFDRLLEQVFTRVTSSTPQILNVR